MDRDRPRAAQRHLLDAGEHGLAVHHLPGGLLHRHDIAVLELHDRPAALGFGREPAHRADRPVDVLVVGVVAQRHHGGPGLQYQVLRREHVLLQPVHQIDRTGRFGVEPVLVVLDLREPQVVQAVGLPVDREQVYGHLAGHGFQPQPGGERHAIAVIHPALTDVGQHGEQFAGILAMLLGQVADGRVQFRPDQRFGDEALRVASGLGVTFAGGHEFGGRGDDVVVPSGDADRRQLEEVAGEHDLHAAERARITPDDAADLIDHVEQPGVQHRDLVDDEDVGVLDLAPAAGPDEFEQRFSQRGGHADAAP